MSSPAASGHHPRVAVVGGGAAGSLVAGELLRRDASVAIDLYERSGVVGPGLAFSTRDPAHLVNVPAGRLSADPEDPTHLVRWLDAEGHDGRPESFPQRRVYGRYLRELFAARREAASVTVLTVSSEEARSLRRVEQGSFELCVAGDPAPRPYDAVVLALGNVAAPPALELPDDPRVYASPWVAGALDRPTGPPDGDVLVIGTGLTAVDAALSLAAAAPEAHLVLASRNGRLPFAHLPGPLRPPAPADGLPRDLTSIDELAEAWCAHVEANTAAGFDWRDIVDGLRPRTQELWRTLSTADQARFLREHRRDWEARRNRAAPQVGARLRALIDDGRLDVVGGGVHSVRAEPGAVFATVGGDTRPFARVVACTGPTEDVTRCSEPLLRQVLADGLAVADPHRLGVRTSDDGALVDADGRVQPSLFTLGWLRRGELWETLAIPEIRVQAAAIAEQLSRRTGSGSPRSIEPAR